MIEKARLLGAGVCLIVATVGAANAQPVNIPVAPAASSPPSGITVAGQEVTAFSGPRAVDPYYQPNGIPIDGTLLRLYPSLSLGASYDDNVYRTPAAQLADWFFTIQPTVVLDYDTSRAKLDLYAQGDFNEYASLTQVNTTNYDFGLQGGYEIAREAQVKAATSFAQYSEPLSSPNTAGFQSAPTQYTDYNANGAVVIKPNRLGVTLSAQYDSYNFLDAPLIGGGTTGNKDRDNDYLRGSVETSYDFSPGYSGFVRLSYNYDNYDRFLDRSGIHRSSHGYQADGGVDLLLGDLIQGEAYLGYLQQDYDEHQTTPLQDISGLDFGANLNWYPTELLTVNLAASRTFQNTTLAGASAGDDKNVSLSAVYELTRQIHLTGKGSYDDTSYKGTSPYRDDQTWMLTVGGKYLVTHYVAVDLDYTYTDRSSTVVAVGYTDNLVRLGLDLQI